jgi:hypothetical protein
MWRCSLALAAFELPRLTRAAIALIVSVVSRLTEAEFDGLARKYHRLKDMFHAFDCDEVAGVDSNGADALDAELLPKHRDKDFRFAKEGTQVLIRQMEERRMLPELGYSESRIFIDPPE